MADGLNWEYRVETIGSTFSQPKDEAFEQMLNEWGEEGWEVISAHNLEGTNKVRLIAKRSLSDRTRRRRSWAEN